MSEEKKELKPQRLFDRNGNEILNGAKYAFCQSFDGADAETVDAIMVLENARHVVSIKQTNDASGSFAGYLGIPTRNHGPLTFAYDAAQKKWFSCQGPKGQADETKQFRVELVLSGRPDTAALHALLCANGMTPVGNIEVSRVVPRKSKQVVIQNLGIIPPAQAVSNAVAASESTETAPSGPERVELAPEPPQPAAPQESPPPAPASTPAATGRRRR